MWYLTWSNENVDLVRMSEDSDNKTFIRKKERQGERERGKVKRRERKYICFEV
jgi:hypothetical protein